MPESKLTKTIELPLEVALNIVKEYLKQKYNLTNGSVIKLVHLNGQYHNGEYVDEYVRDNTRYRL